jgi:DNA-binding CsgD family transcriptional regulator
MLAKLERELIDIAHGGLALAAFRSHALERILATFGGEVGMYLDAGGSPPAASAAVLEFAPDAWSALSGSWGQWEREIAPLLGAMRTQGAVVDREVMGAQWERLDFFDQVVRPAGLSSTMVAHIALPGTAPAFLLLGRTGRRQFTEASAAQMRALRPVLNVADAACRSSRLLPNVTLDALDRKLIELVRLGYSNAEVASALCLSPFTVRNRLARVACLLER